MTGNCPATGKPHVTILEREHLFCLDCRQVIETCCEGPVMSAPTGPEPPAQNKD